MKAVIYEKYGGPEVLEIREIAKPVPGDNEVLIKVHAVSINDWDCGLLEGDFVNRLLNGFGKPKKQILGSDVAGRVEAVGKHVKSFRPGDEVFGDLSGKWGGLAEYVCADESALAMKPPGMSFQQAAAIPQAGMLAVQGLIDVSQIKAGQRLLINGAGGGVGTFAIQIARLFGAEVTAVDKRHKLDMLRSIGAAHVIDYAEEDFTKSRGDYDVIFDVKTKRSIFDLLRPLKARGMYVTAGGTMGRLIQALVCRPLVSLLSRKRVRIVVLKPNKDLVYMNGLFESGSLKPVIDGPFKLTEVRDAFSLFLKGDHAGKVVISMAG